MMAKHFTKFDWPPEKAPASERRRTRGAESGFVLIEALIAILILSIGLAALVHSARESVVATHDRRYGFLPAHDLANRVLTELELAARDSVRGQFPPLSGKEGPFRYHVQATDWPANPSLREVSVTVTWVGQRKPGSVRLTTLLPNRSGEE